MIHFNRYTLPNGLRVLAHKDPTAPVIAFNILYNVGSKNEDPERTGLAHLFEHLMFGGTSNIRSFDSILEEAGGSSNAFTSNDITSYYITIPKQNLEVAFWLESDRMNALELSQKSIDVQKAVVAEEFKQRYLNQPYGDIWHLLRPLAYKVHPYRWPTIGRELSHISSFTEKEIHAFFSGYYCPGNAILSVAGNIEPEEVFELARKWFGPIHRNSGINRNIPSEPEQTAGRELSVERNIPQNAVYLAFHCPGRKEPGFYAADLLSDMLCGNESAAVYREMVKNKQLFAELDSFITGDSDSGLLILAGKISDGIDVMMAVDSLRSTISGFIDEIRFPGDLEKVKHKTETAISYSGLKALDKAMNLAYFENLSAAEMANTELDNYNKVTENDIFNLGRTILDFNKASFLYYLKEPVHP